METINASELYHYIVKMGNVVNITDINNIGVNIRRPIVTVRTSCPNEKYLTNLYERGIISQKPVRFVVYQYKECKLIQIINDNELVYTNITIKEDIIDSDLAHSENDRINELLDVNIHKIFERNIKHYKLFRDNLCRTDYGAERGLIRNRDCIIVDGDRRFINFRKIDKTKDYSTEPEFLLSQLKISFHQYSDNTDKSKAFDFITATLPVIRRNNSNEQIIDKFKSEKSMIYDRMMKKIRSRSQYKQFEVPFNYFRCTKLTLRRDDIMEFTFEIKDV